MPPGPWAAQFLREHAGTCAAPKALRLVKGSHIVVRKLFDHDHAYIFQNADRRIIFAIPYEGDFTLIGTTDVEHQGPIGEARIDADEIALPVRAGEPLLRARGRAGRRGVELLRRASAARRRGGDPSAVTRDYLLELDDRSRRRCSRVGRQDHDLSQARRRGGRPAACAAARHARRRGRAGAVLPGGDLTAGSAAAAGPITDIARFDSRARARGIRSCPPRVRRRWRAQLRLARGAAAGRRRLGAEVAPGLYEAELRYLHDHEWARSADDVLWRRSKLGLHYERCRTRPRGELVRSSTPAATRAAATPPLEHAWN